MQVNMPYIDSRWYGIIFPVAFTPFFQDHFVVPRIFNQHIQFGLTCRDTHLGFSGTQQLTSSPSEISWEMPKPQLHSKTY